MTGVRQSPFRLCRAGRVQRITVGKIVLHRVESLRKWLENQEIGALWTVAWSVPVPDEEQQLDHEVD